MSKKRLTDPSQIPLHMNKREEAEFWSSHEITKEFLGKVEHTVAGELPPRSKSISVRFDEDVLQRLRKLAAQRAKKYQTLLKEFVVERLYEEEKRQQGAYLSTGQAWYGVTATCVVSSSAGPTEVAVNNQSLSFDNPALMSGWANEVQGISGSIATSDAVTTQCSAHLSNADGLAIRTTRNLEKKDRFVAHGSD